MQFETTPAQTTQAARNAAQAEIERLTDEFLKNGGAIKKGNPEPDPGDDYLSEAEAAAFLGLKEAKLRNARALGAIWGCPCPPFTYFGQRAAFSVKKLTEWKEAYGSKAIRKGNRA